MKVQSPILSRVMVWMTLPLMIGFGYWEHSMPMTDLAHRLTQLVLLFVVFGWANYWNTQAEYDRLRHRGGFQPPSPQSKRQSSGTDLHEKISARLITRHQSSHEDAQNSPWEVRQHGSNI